MADIGAPQERHAGDSRIDWDLLQPTLTAKDDFVGFRRPFNPWVVLVVAGICRPVVGSWLIAYNAWRLGLGRQAVPLVLAGFAVPVALFSVVVMTHTPQDLTPERRELIRWLLNLGSALLALTVMRGHLRRFRLFQLCDGEPASLWVTGAVAVGLLFVVDGYAIEWAGQVALWLKGTG